MGHGWRLSSWGIAHVARGQVMRELGGLRRGTVEQNKGVKWEKESCLSDTKLTGLANHREARCCDKHSRMQSRCPGTPQAQSIDWFLASGWRVWD